MMDDTPRHIFAHNAYVKALWERSAPPECFTDTDEAIILAHNRAVGDVFAAAKKDFDILYNEYQRLLTYSNLRENKIATLESKLK